MRNGPRRLRGEYSTRNRAVRTETGKAMAKAMMAIITVQYRIETIPNSGGDASGRHEVEVKKPKPTWEKTRVDRAKRKNPINARITN